jgi:hypothetical protein
MTRESIESKGRRYLLEGRLVVTRVDGDHVSACCRGDGEVYQCGHEPDRGWWCSCPARTDQCSHLAALRLVTIRRSA